jgi:hypothetical protein
MGNAANISVGPGLIYAAPIDTTDPTDATTALAAAWVPIGYTEDGFSINTSPTVEDVEVAEEQDPVLSYTTKRSMQVEFQMAEVTATNLCLALNQGIVDAGDVAGGLEPLAPADEVRIKIVHQTDQGARWLLRKCYNAGQLAIARRKAPQKALFSVQFRLEIPGGGVKPWKAFPNADGLV